MCVVVRLEMNVLVEFLHLCLRLDPFPCVLKGDTLNAEING